MTTLLLSLGKMVGLQLITLPFFPTYDGDRGGTGTGPSVRDDRLLNMVASTRDLSLLHPSASGFFSIGEFSDAALDSGESKRALREAILRTTILFRPFRFCSFWATELCGRSGGLG